MKIDKKLKLVAIIFYSWVLVFFLRMIPIGGTWGSLSINTILVISLWFIFYFTFVFLGTRSKEKSSDKSTLTLNTFSLNKWVKILSIASIIGAILIIYEFSITRGYGFTTPVSEIRILEVQASLENFSGSWTSGIGRMLTPALMIAWVIAILIWSQLITKVLFYLILASLVVFYQQFMFEGGRFFIAALLIMIWLSSKSNFRSKSKPNLKKKIFFLVIAIIAILFFSFVFVDRFREKDFYTAYANWSNIFNLTLGESLQSRLNGEFSTIWLSMSMLWVYLTQGINELDNIINAGYINHAWGTFQFPQLIQAINKITGGNYSYNVFENIPNPGTYISLYGASYVDFGHIGSIIFISIIGWLTGKSIKSFHDKKLDLLTLNAPILITLGIFSPTVSLIVNLWPAFFWGMIASFFIKKSLKKSTNNSDFLKASLNK